MRKAIRKTLTAAALIAAGLVAGISQAAAGTITTTAFNADFSDAYFSAVSQQRNTFTLTFNDPYTSNGEDGLYRIRTWLYFTANDGYVMTGNTRLSIDARYQLDDAATGGAAGIGAGYDVLAPLCPPCGPYPGDIIGSDFDGDSAQGPQGTLHVDLSAAAQTGAYADIMLYLLILPSLSPAFGSLWIDAVSFTIDAVAAPVPELPPAALLAAGLVLLAVAARSRRSISGGSPPAG